MKKQNNATLYNISQNIMEKQVRQIISKSKLTCAQQLIMINNKLLNANFKLVHEHTPSSCHKNQFISKNLKSFL